MSEYLQPDSGSRSRYLLPHECQPAHAPQSPGPHEPVAPAGYRADLCPGSTGICRHPGRTDRGAGATHYPLWPVAGSVARARAQHDVCLHAQSRRQCVSPLRGTVRSFVNAMTQHLAPSTKSPRATPHGVLASVSATNRLLQSGLDLWQQVVTELDLSCTGASVGLTPNGDLSGVCVRRTGRGDLPVYQLIWR